MRLCLFLIQFPLVVFGQTQNPGPPQPENMVEILARLPTRINPLEVSFLNRERSQMLTKELQGNTDLNRFLSLGPQLAKEMLRAGESDRAIAAFEQLRKVILERGVPFEGEQKFWLLHRLGLAYLRLGEQQNCQLNHSSASCIFPIQGEGIHKLRRGSEGAIEVFSEILREKPHDLKAKWLLNIAYMTLDLYPQKVPSAWLIEPKALTSAEVSPHFKDIAGQVGLDVDALSGGSIVEDFDNDGFLDLVVSSWGLRDQLQYFRNLGDGRYENQTEAAGLKGQVGGLNIMQADYNNDGFQDILILRGAWMSNHGRHPNSLLRNDGKGRFTDVTHKSGLLSFKPTQTAVWLDFDNDGWLDLFIGNESDKNATFPCELFRNNRDGTFTDIADQVGLANIGFVKGVTAGDFDNDGWTDLYLSRYTQTNILFKNMGPQQKPGTWTFKDVTQSAGVAEPLLSFPTWFWDFDNDGDLDLFVSDYENRSVEPVVADYLDLAHQGERSRLYRNDGSGRFEDISEAVGLNKVLTAMGSNFGDLNNDGWLDLYLGTGSPSLSMLVPNRMFLNRQGRRFSDITTAGGFGHLQKGHGVSFADMDHDGDQDVYIVMGGAYTGDTYRNALFENPGNNNAWIKLKFQGTQTNQSAVGVRFSLTVGQGKNQWAIHRQVNSGGSFGASPLRQEIGLGKADRIIELKVYWPVTKKLQRYKKLQKNQYYLVSEGQEELRNLELKPVPFQKNMTADHGHRH